MVLLGIYRAQLECERERVFAFLILGQGQAD